MPIKIPTGGKPVRHSIIRIVWAIGAGALFVAVALLMIIDFTKSPWLPFFEGCVTPCEYIHDARTEVRIARSAIPVWCFMLGYSLFWGGLAGRRHLKHGTPFEEELGPITRRRWFLERFAMGVFWTILTYLALFAWRNAVL